MGSGMTYAYNKIILYCVQFWHYSYYRIYKKRILKSPITIRAVVEHSGFNCSSRCLFFVDWWWEWICCDFQVGGKKHLLSHLGVKTINKCHNRSIWPFVTQPDQAVCLIQTGIKEAIQVTTGTTQVPVFNDRIPGFHRSHKAHMH